MTTEPGDSQPSARQPGVETPSDNRDSPHMNTDAADQFSKNRLARLHHIQVCII